MARHTLRPRLRVSPELVDGSVGAMVASHCFAALGGAGELRLWRTTVHLLSAVFVDAGRAPGISPALETGARGLRRLCANAIRMQHVLAGAGVSAAGSVAVCGRVLCRQPVSRSDC